MLLFWWNLTVLEHVVGVFQQAGVEDIVVVPGSERERVERIVSHYPLRRVHNEGYTNGEMLSSLQCGLKVLKPQRQATLIGLGDQSQVQEGSLRSICAAYQSMGAELIVPSFQMGRGHPGRVGHKLWGALPACRCPSRGAIS